MINDTLNEADAKMDKAVEVTREDFAAIRTGRAHPSMFHKLTADYYGTPTPLQQLASFTAPEARVIIISPYDQSAMAAIEKSIRDSDLGVNPTDDGKTIRVVLPELTEERRKDYIKMAKAQGRGRPGLGPQHPPQRQAGARQAGEGRRGRQGRRHRRREAARRASPRSTSTRSTRCSSTRKPSCSRSEPQVGPTTSMTTPETDPAAGAAQPAAKKSRAGRNLPAAIASGGGAARSPSARRLAFWKAALHGHRGRRGPGRRSGSSARRFATPRRSSCPASR